MADNQGSEQRLKKTLILNVIEFLRNETSNPALSEERQESIEVAIQCLETAYEVSGDTQEQLPQVDLLACVRAAIPDGPSAEDLAQAELHKVLGNNAMKESKYAEAVAYYTMAIQLNPNNAVFYCNRAAAYSRLNRHIDAIKDCKDAIRLDPKYGKAYGRLGIAYSNLNMFEKAYDAYSLALKHDPNNQMYETNMRLAQERLGEAAGTPGPTRPQFDLGSFISNESFMSMARDMMTNPEFVDVVSGIMAMGQSGDSNVDALLQAGQSLATGISSIDPSIMENLRRQFGAPAGNPANVDDNENPDNPQPGANEVEGAVPADAGQVAGQAAEVAPEAAEVAPEAAEVAPEAAEVAPEAAEVAPEAAPVVADPRQAPRAPARGDPRQARRAPAGAVRLPEQVDGPIRAIPVVLDADVVAAALAAAPAGSVPLPLPVSGPTRAPRNATVQHRSLTTHPAALAQRAAERAARGPPPGEQVGTVGDGARGRVRIRPMRNPNNPNGNDESTSGPAGDAGADA